jgi:hypothetical protein
MGQHVVSHEITVQAGRLESFIVRTDMLLYPSTIMQFNFLQCHSVIRVPQGDKERYNSGISKAGGVSPKSRDHLPSRELPMREGSAVLRITSTNKLHATPSKCQPRCSVNHHSFQYILNLFRTPFVDVHRELLTT